MNKKSIFGMSTVAEFIILLIVIITLIIMVFFLSDKGTELGERIINILRFS